MLPPVSLEEAAKPRQTRVWSRHPGPMPSEVVQRLYCGALIVLYSTKLCIPSSLLESFPKASKIRKFLSESWQSADAGSGVFANS